MRVEIRLDTKTRFLCKVDRKGPFHPVLQSHCWQWKGSTRGQGYGQFWYKGSNAKASRVAYILLVGSIPNGKFVLHHCDNRLCVNPDHLWLGTHTDNMKDRNDKDRQSSGDNHWTRVHPEKVLRGKDNGRAKHPERLRGEKIGCSKLTEEIVKNMRRRHSLGETKAELARYHGVTFRTAKLAIERSTWKHVE